jgi:P4 family phage/plasmid primase-like protien
MALSERDLLEIISKKEYSREQLKAMLVGAALYKRGFNVIPVTSSGEPVSALIGVDASSRLPLAKLLEGFVDVGFNGVAISNTSLLGNPGKLLYVVRARREVVERCRALNELINSTVTWRRGDRVEALIVVDEASSKLLSKLVKREDIEIAAPHMLVVAGVGVEPIREFDLDSPTLGIREVSEVELKRLLEETGLLVEEASKLIASTEATSKELKRTLKELSDEKLSELESLVTPILERVECKLDVLRLIAGWLSRALISPASTARLLKSLVERSGGVNVEDALRLVICEYRNAGLDIEAYREDIERALGVKISEVESYTGECIDTEWSLEGLLAEVDYAELGALFEELKVSSGIPEETAMLAIELGTRLDIVEELLEVEKSKRLSERLTRAASLVAESILHHLKYVKNFSVGDVDLGLHCWDGKRYRECGGLIGKLIEKHHRLLRLGDCGVRLTSLEKEVVRTLEHRTREPLKYEPSSIAFENCVFDWDLLACMPHSPSRLIFHYIPHKIDVELLNTLLKAGSTPEDVVEKHAPRTLKAFKDWVGDRWVLLFEIMGFVLYPKPYKKAILLVDAEGKEGDTGKSTYIKYLQLVLGSENYSAVPLHALVDLDKRFVASQIYRKLANLYADLPGKALSEIGQFKVLTGGDSVTIDRKRKEPFTWTPYTKHIFSANKPPPVAKADTAFWKRWLVVEFTGSFEKPIRDFENTLVGEIPQAVAIGIAAFYNVLKRGSFSFENTPEDARHKWMSRTDTVYAFMEWFKSSGALVENPTGRVIVDDLYKYYVKYCNYIDAEPEEQSQFTKRLKELGYTIKRPKNYSTLYGYSLNGEKLRELLERLYSDEGGESGESER